MHFRVKSTLKNNHNQTPKHVRSFPDDQVSFSLILMNWGTDV